MKKLFQKTLECCNLFIIVTKLKKICKKAVCCYPHGLKYDLDFYMTCVKNEIFLKKTVNTCLFMLDYVPDCYKTQEMFGKTVS